jgi:hypothetical protein
MESGPPKIIEVVVGWLIPPACREEVLGDLRERSGNPARYLMEAAHTVPCVIYSRIRRTTDAVVALMEAVSMYTAFVMAAGWLDRRLLFDQSGFLRLAIPPMVALAVLMLADAYSNPRRLWPLKPIFGVILAIGAALACEAWLDRWSLPGSVLAWGSGMSALLISTLRLIFPPITERPQAAHAPAFWQKLELSPLAVRIKDPIVPVAIVLVLILYHLLRK